MKTVPRESPTHHTQKIKPQLHQLLEHLRRDVGEVTESNVQANFESPAEVSTDLVKAIRSLPGFL